MPNPRHADTVYTVSGARDHFREQSRASGFQIERVAEFRNFFSELPTHPSQTYRFKHNDKLPPFVDREFVPQQSSAADRRAKSKWTNVTGSNRFKFFRRPQYVTKLPELMPLPTSVAGVQLADYVGHVPNSASEQDAEAMGATEEPGGGVTIGTQSDYRESEAQTIPYSPDYVLTEEEPNPEVLMLAGLKFGQGLPGGLPEVETVEKAREKAAFEASLPAPNDLKNLPLRKRMMEAWEAKEFAEREAELAKLQEERLNVMRKQLAAREDGRERYHAERLDVLKRTKLEETRKAFANIQRRRNTNMRKLAGQRRKTGQSVPTSGRSHLKRDVIREYAEGSSEVYAPLTRNGVFTDKPMQGKEINPEPFVPADLQGVNRLESSLPRKAVFPTVEAPTPLSERVPKDSAQRQAAAIAARLEHISELLETSKAEGGRGHGDAWPRPNEVSVGKAPKATLRRRASKGLGERPVTPTFEAPEGDNARVVGAVRLLQRLLRGRAAQNAMHEGKERRSALIRELYTPRPTYADPALSADAQAAEKTLGETVAQLLMALAGAGDVDASAILVEPKQDTYDDGGMTEDAAALRIQSVQRGRKARADAQARRTKAAEEAASEAASAAAAMEAAAKEAMVAAIGSAPDAHSVGPASQPQTPAIARRPVEEDAITATEAKAMAREVTAELVRGVVLESLFTDQDAADDTVAELVSELSAVALEKAEAAMEDLEPGVRPMSPGSAFMAQAGASLLADEALASILADSGVQIVADEELAREAAKQEEKEAEENMAADAALEAALAATEDLPELPDLTPEETMAADAALAAALAATEDLLELPDLSAEDQARLVKVQSAARGHLARKRVAAKKQDAAEDAAALKIQAVVRGRAARKEVEGLKAAAATSEPETAAEPEATAEPEAAAEPEATAE